MLADVAAAAQGAGIAHLGGEALGADDDVEISEHRILTLDLVGLVVHQHRDDITGGEGCIDDNFLAVHVTTPSLVLPFKFHMMLRAVDDYVVIHFLLLCPWPSAALPSNHPGVLQYHLINR